jgi:hypothetical protein
MFSKVQEVKDGLKALLKQIEDDANSNTEIQNTTIIVDFSDAHDFRVVVNDPKSLHIDKNLVENYRTRGGTALFDAMARAFDLVPQEQSSVFVNILTDGEENSSRTYNSEMIRGIVEDKKNKNWAITFMGTTEDALNTAVSIGISKDNTFEFANSSAGVTRGMGKALKAKAAYFSNTVAYMSGDLSEADMTLANNSLMTDNASSGTTNAGLGTITTTNASLTDANTQAFDQVGISKNRKGTVKKDDKDNS